MICADAHDLRLTRMIEMHLNPFALLRTGVKVLFVDGGGMMDLSTGNVIGLILIVLAAVSAIAYLMHEE